MMNFIFVTYICFSFNILYHNVYHGFVFILFHIHFVLTCMCMCVWVCRCFFMLNSWAHGSWKHITETAEGRLYIPALNYPACSLMHMKFLALINNRQLLTVA